MINITIALVLFLLTTAMHIAIYRLGWNRKQMHLFTIFTFMLGFTINLVFQFSVAPIVDFYLLRTGDRFPITAIALYLFLSMILMLFFSSIFWRQESPSFTILFLVKQRKKMSFKDLTSYFSNKTLIESRMLDLLNGQYVQKKGTNYYLTSKGKLIYFYTSLYRSMLHWESGG